MELTIQGTEVLLRPLVRGDADSLAHAASESREHFGLTTVPDGAEEALSYIEEALASLDRLAFAVEWRGALVGTTSYLGIKTWQWPVGCRLQRKGLPDAVEIGATWLAKSAQRTRCNTESKYLLLTHAFEEWEVHCVSLKTDARNERSRRAIERIGARFEGIRRAEKPATDCTVRDSAYYSIIAAEWPAVKRDLETMMSR